jgi:hypothetical protein
LPDFIKSSLKPLCQMNQNLVGSIYGKSTITIVYFLFQFIWLTDFRGED